MLFKPLTRLLLVCCIAFTAHSRNNTDLVDKTANFPSSFFAKVNKKTTSLEGGFTRQSEKCLQRLAGLQTRSMVQGCFHNKQIFQEDQTAVDVGFFELSTGAWNATGEVQQGWL
jgi:hypothetical protein